MAISVENCTKFSHPVYFAPSLTGYPWNWVSAWGQKNRNDGATRRSKKFQDWFSRLDTMPAWDIHPAIQPSSHIATEIAALCYASREQVIFATTKNGLRSRSQGSPTTLSRPHAPSKPIPRCLLRIVHYAFVRCFDNCAKAICKRFGVLALRDEFY